MSPPPIDLLEIEQEYQKLNESLTKLNNVTDAQRKKYGEKKLTALKLSINNRRIALYHIISSHDIIPFPKGTVVENRKMSIYG